MSESKEEVMKEDEFVEATAAFLLSGNDWRRYDYPEPPATATAEEVEQWKKDFDNVIADLHADEEPFDYEWRSATQQWIAMMYDWLASHGRVVNVTQFADGVHSQKRRDECRQYIAKLEGEELMVQAGNVLRSLHGWDAHGCYGSDELQEIAALHAILSELYGRIGEEQVEKHFAELLEKQKRDLCTLQAEDGCCDRDDESGPLDSYFHIFTDEEVRANSKQ